MASLFRKLCRNSKANIFSKALSYFLLRVCFSQLCCHGNIHYLLHRLVRWTLCIRAMGFVEDYTQVQPHLQTSFVRLTGVALWDHWCICKELVCAGGQKSIEILVLSLSDLHHWKCVYCGCNQHGSFGTNRLDWRLQTWLVFTDLDQSQDHCSHSSWAAEQQEPDNSTTCHGFKWHARAIVVTLDWAMLWSYCLQYSWTPHCHTWQYKTNTKLLSFNLCGHVILFPVLTFNDVDVVELVLH